MFSKMILRYGNSGNLFFFRDNLYTSYLIKLCSLGLFEGTIKKNTSEWIKVEYAITTFTDYT